MKHIFIINPTAGKYDSRQRIYEMADHLRSAHGLDVQCILTKKQGIKDCFYPVRIYLPAFYHSIDLT